VAPVPHAVLFRKRANPFAEWLRLLLAEVGTPPVQPLVTLELLGPVSRELLEEVLARARP